ncbi:MAG: hypothetical protein K2W82_11780 [Candidatus Obscuribacterales bacterium]|nr:hypothetical protein [Candidatus Obscuribacterales bacterium]
MLANSAESHQPTNNRVELSGLEELFEQQIEAVLARGLTLREAAIFYGIKRKELKSQVKKDLIPAIKVIDGESSKWLVYPDGVPDELETLSRQQIEAEQALLDCTPDPAEPILMQAEVPTVNETKITAKVRLQIKIAELEARLAAVEHYNAYLETRLVGLEDQIKFFNLTHFRKPAINALAVLIPAAIIVSAILLNCISHLPSS